VGHKFWDEFTLMRKIVMERDKDARKRGLNED
jgi:hypothetical protein